MEEIKRQVGRAQRRLVLQQFFLICGWSLFATLLIAAIGLAIPRIWALPIVQQTWDLSWIAGGVAVGLLIAALWTFLVRRSRLDAAIELDRRFGLKERVSSTLALNSQELSSDIGMALVTDASRRIERIDVREQFRVSPTWRIALPIAPAFAIAALVMLPAAAMKQAQATSNPPEEVKKQIKTATIKLQEKLRENQKRNEELGLKDGDLLKEVNRELDKLVNKDTADRKEALIKINDLAKEVEKRKQDLGGAEKVRKDMDKLKDIAKGPADKMADALKEGDFGKAEEAMKKLTAELNAGTLSKEDQEKLAKQLEQVKEKLEQAVQQQQENRERLKQQIQQKISEGNVGEAARLQQQLDQLEANADQQEAMMQQLADKFGEAAKNLQAEGDPKKAAEQLDKLAGDLAKMEKQLEEAANLQEVLDQLEDAKDALNCQACQGQGCAQCQGAADDGKQAGKSGSNQGNGKTGRGQGSGARDEEETDKGFYDTRVATDAKAGQSVKIGEVGGPNKAGKSLEAIKDEIKASLAKEPDALEDVTLPRDQRENAKQYFERFRKGE